MENIPRASTQQTKKTVLTFPIGSKANISHASPPRGLGVWAGYQVTILDHFQGCWLHVQVTNSFGSHNEGKIVDLLPENLEA